MPFSPQDFQNKTAYTFDDLLALVRFLRSPEGCEWDQVQTHESVRRNLLEEAYEVAEGIDRDDPVILREELGDYLFQAAFHIAIEEEKGRFLPSDVLCDICRKMIRRHPHLFSQASQDLPHPAASVSWDELKRAEKGQASVEDVLRMLPRTLPALMYAQKVVEKAASMGFFREDREKIEKKIAEEWQAFVIAQNKETQVIALGELLFSLVNYACLLGLNAEEALSRAALHFCSHLTTIKQKLV